MNLGPGAMLLHVKDPSFAGYADMGDVRILQQLLVRHWS